VDLSKDRRNAGAAKRRVWPGRPAEGGALRVGPEAKRSGRCAIRTEQASWNCGSTRMRRNPETQGLRRRAMWGLMQADGIWRRWAIYAPYLDGAGTYAVSTSIRRSRSLGSSDVPGNPACPRLHKWTFDFDADEGMRLLYDDRT